MVERLDVAAADTVASSRERIKTPFAKIFVSDNPEKTYYHIAWWQDGQMQIGYSSTNLTFVKRWLRDEFEIEAPAADVAPVVRCKDCKCSTLPSKQTQIYGKPGTLTCHNRKSPCNRRNVASDDYCSHGEKNSEVNT